MPRFFNTSGPNRPELHYTLPVLDRLPQVHTLIDQQQYFVLHAPRQVGKTTTLLTLGQELTAQGRYTAVLLSVEQGAFTTDPGEAELAILGSWRRQAAAWLPPSLQPPPWPDAAPGERIGAALGAWANASSQPLVVFLDEIDALRDDVLIGVLHQIRASFPSRPRHFPSSIALIGLRDVRDYKVASREHGRLGTASPFNIKAESLTLRSFTQAEVARLYEQHTSETGQAFLPDAVLRAFEVTQGQPWLVNALARQLTEVLVQDQATAITVHDVDEAKDLLIRRRDTHLDSLIDRLREPRVRAILEPMLAGDLLGDVPTDDIHFVLDLGLCRMDPTGGLMVANPIYKEIVVRELTFSRHASLPPISTTWLTPAGELDEAALLDAFLAFWRQHGEPLMTSAPYHEIAPHLVLMAFLHRVINGGSIEREYAIGSGRMDLCLRYGGRTIGIEIKVWRKSDPQTEGLQQLDRYLAGLGLDSGWLMIFDRRPNAPPVAERLGTSEVTSPGGRRVTVVRA